MDRSNGPLLMPAPRVQMSIASFTHSGTGIVRMWPPFPRRSAMTQWPSRSGSRRKVVFEEAAAGVVETVNRRFKELWENPLLVFPQLRQFPQRFSPPQFGYPVGKNPPHKKAHQVSRLGQGPVSANSTLFRS